MLYNKVTAIEKAGIVKTWPASIPVRNGTTVDGRICVIRKTEEAIKMAHERILREAQKRQVSIRQDTLDYAKYIIVFSNYPSDSFSDIDILEWYRSRWQVELVFKRFKSIAQLGHIPKHSDESSKAWLYGKLFVALLTEKLIQYASSVSPWGYNLEAEPTSERMA